jgi:hypothetical protein
MHGVAKTGEILMSKIAKPANLLGSRWEFGLDYYKIFSVDTDAFNRLTTAPTQKQCLAVAGLIVDSLPWMLDDYDDQVDRTKWPLTPELLAAEIQKRLSSKDWYADFKSGDAEIWNTLLEEMIAYDHKAIGLGNRLETSDLLDARVVAMASRKGAKLFSPKKFGRAGFRHQSRLRFDPQFIYSIHSPAETKQLFIELEKIAPYFEQLPDEKSCDRDMFESGLLNPLRRIVKAGRSMWVQLEH